MVRFWTSLTVFSIAYLCTTLDIMRIKCSVVCNQDGDEIGIVIEDKCYCGNSRDISKVIYRVPKNSGQASEKKKVNYYYGTE